jgi:hypothetical protein
MPQAHDGVMSDSTPRDVRDSGCPRYGMPDEHQPDGPLLFVADPHRSSATRSSEVAPRLGPVPSRGRRGVIAPSRSYAHARVAVAPVDSTSSLKNSATATKRWTREETRTRAAVSPEFRYPSPDPGQMDDLVRQYELATGDRVRTQPKRNFLAACYRVHGDDLLPYAAELLQRTGTTTNLLGELRTREPRDGAARAKGSDQVQAVGTSPRLEQETASDDWIVSQLEDDGRDTGGPLADQVVRPSRENAESAWCGCSEDELRPGVLYCSGHYRYGAFPDHRYDRRPSNPHAVSFYAAHELEPVSPAAALGPPS